MGKNDILSISISCEIMDRFRSNFASQYSKFSTLSIFLTNKPINFLKTAKWIFFNTNRNLYDLISAGATSLSVDFLFLLKNINLSPAEPGYALILKTVDPDQLASEEAKRSGSTLFVIQYVNLYQQSGLSNLIG